MQIILPEGSWLNRTELFSVEGIPFWSQTEMDPIPVTDQDQYIQLTQEQARRVDLLAFDSYGDPVLYWAILHANEIDLPNQLVEGMVIRIPNLETIRTWLEQVS